MVTPLTFVFSHLYSKTVLTQMIKDLAQQAVSQALSGNWDQARLLNKKVLKVTPKDVDALNRLARAYSELGDLKKARFTAKKVISIDPFNNIANKSLQKWKGLKRGETFTSGQLSAPLFLEEPGKTKIVSLIHLGDTKAIAKLDSGDELKIEPHSHRISILSLSGNYIGRLSDDLSARLKKLIKYGNEYQAYVKSLDPKEVKIFLREVKRVKKLTDIPSFSTEKIDYISFTPPELVRKKDKIMETEEDEE